MEYDIGDELIAVRLCYWDHTILTSQARDFAVDQLVCGMWGVYHKTKPKDSVYAIAIKGNGAYKVLVTHPNCAGAKINDCAYGEPKQKKELMNVRLVSDETLIPGWYIRSNPEYVHWVATRPIVAGDVIWGSFGANYWRDGKLKPPANPINSPGMSIQPIRHIAVYCVVDGPDGSDSEGEQPDGDEKQELPINEDEDDEDEELVTEVDQMVSNAQ